MRIDKSVVIRFGLMAMMAFSVAVTGCGNDGQNGQDGEDGEQGPPGPQGPPGTGVEPIVAAKVESCGTCHGGAGDEHQEIYDGYVDESALVMTIDDVNSEAVGACSTTTATPCTTNADCPQGETCLFEVTVDISITKNGLPFIDADGLPSLDEKRFETIQYNSTTEEYLNNCRLRDFVSVVGDPGAYEVTGNCDYRPETPLPPFDGSHVYGYIAQTPLFEHEGAGGEFPSGHVHLYDDVSNAAIAYGTAQADDQDSYVSAANVAACNKCHGTPYLKHGFRAAQIGACDGDVNDPCFTDADCDATATCDAIIPDFAACKSCHWDDRRPGFIYDFQYMVDQPFNWATAALPAAEVRATYDYRLTVMNDTHMSHAMEFPYPMSMANCATCHEGKLSPGVLDNSNFVWETCVSCHSVLGTDAWPELADDEPGGPQPAGKYYQAGRAPALTYIWTKGDVLPVHQNLGPGADCTSCHGDPTVNAPTFDEYHTGYDVRIYDADGNRYADTYTASIGTITLTGNSLRIGYGTSDATVGAEVLVSFYGWDSKHFLVASHERDGSTNCESRGEPAGCRFEYASGDTNPLFTEDAASEPGAWIVTADLAAFQAVKTDDIPTLIANGQVNKAEITVLPSLTLDGVSLALDAVTQTFDLGTGMNVDDYFKGENATVDVKLCNVCHDQLGPTFHSFAGLGNDIVACKNCHNPTFDGGHLEMTSRSIENYVHSIHTFQDFDTDEKFAMFDPVFSKRYDQHIKHVFPNFTIRNCEACHFEGTYNVPDQSESMPGVLSESYDVATWYEMVPTMAPNNIPSSIAMEDPAGRNLGSRVEVVTGPASRACGACHRSRLINQDEGGALASFDAHTQANGTYVPNDEDDEVLYGVIDKIMSLFE